MARDVHFNTPEQVHNYMIEALKVLKSAKVPDDLRAAALPIIYNSITSKQVFMDQSDVSGGVLLAAPGPNTPRLQ
jgi:hypothetical protein